MKRLIAAILTLATGSAPVLAQSAPMPEPKVFAAFENAVTTAGLHPVETTMLRSALVKWFASAGDDRDDALIQCVARSESAAAAPAARYYAAFVPCLAGMPITPDEVAPAFNAALADVGAKRSSVIDIAQFIRGAEPASLTGTGGIGLSLQLVDGRATIVRANAGGPAWAENFVAGSVLLAIDDTPTLGQPIEAVIARLRGDAGSTVALRVVAPDAVERTVTLRRAPLEDLRRTVFPLDVGDTRVIELTQLTSDSPSELREALSRRPVPAQIVIDLRGNGGGLLDSGVEIADMFMDKGLIVEVRGPMAERPQSERYKADRAAVLRNVPLTLIVDADTAAGAEIFAGALRDSGRARLVGTKTFGRGSVETLLPLSRTWALKLTTGDVVLPGGGRLEGIGLTPDCIAPDLPRQSAALAAWLAVPTACPAPLQLTARPPSG